MKDRTLSSAAIIIGGALLVVLLAAGQEKRQEWSLRTTRSADRVHFRVERSQPGSNWSHSSDVPRDRFRGLAEAMSGSGRVKFEYVQDAGKLICEGRFFRGEGTGSFTFEQNPAFGAELRKLGYSAPDDEEVFGMMMGGVTLDFARGVRDAGLRATTQQLTELRIHGVDLELISEAQRAGYREFDAQNFIELRIHGVNAAYLRDLKAAGYDLGPKDIVELKIHGVSPEFIADLKDAGYDLSSKQVVELRIHGVSSEFLRDLKRYGLQPPAADIVQMRIHGVSAEYLKGLKEAGYESLPASQITEFRIHGLSTEFLRDAKALGYTFTPRELVDLRVQGVDASYLQRLRDAGMRNLTASQIIKLKIHGVD